MQEYVEGTPSNHQTAAVLRKLQRFVGCKDVVDITTSLQLPKTLRCLEYGCSGPDREPGMFQLIVPNLQIQADQLPMLTGRGLRKMMVALSCELSFRGGVREENEEVQLAHEASGGKGSAFPPEELLEIVRTRGAHGEEHEEDYRIPPDGGGVSKHMSNETKTGCLGLHRLYNIYYRVIWWFFHKPWHKDRDPS